MAIFGKIENLTPLFSKTEELEYLGAHIRSLFKQDFLKKISALKVGENFQIQLDYGMFAISHCYMLKRFQEGFFESHHQYIDFQVVVQGFERYFVGNKDHFHLIQDYDESKDLEVHSPKNPLSEIRLQEGELCVLFPFDVHGVGIGREQEVGEIVRKTIIKVPATLIKHRL